MYLMELSTKLLVVLLTDHAIYVASLYHRRQCFDVGEQNICYFRPNVSTVNWETAWKTCRELKATLPVIPDKEVQAVFEKYLSNSPAFLPVWTAGRYIGDSEWKWINGQTFQGKDEPPCPSHLTARSRACYHETQAALTHQLKYEASYPLAQLPYLCRFTGASCTSGSIDSIRWEDGCIEWDKNDRKSLNEARNKCLERGGDLVTFRGQDDLQRLQQLLPSHMFANVTKYWIGLHRKWWIWNATDVQDIKYNLVDIPNDDKRDCLFITNSYAWRQGNCAMTIYVMCQTVTSILTSTSTWSETRTQDNSTGIVIGAIVGLVIIIIDVVLIVGLIIVRRRNRNQGTDERHRISQEENPTQQVEFRRGAEETTNVYEELAQTAQDDQHGNYVNVPQASSLYTALRF